MTRPDQTTVEALLATARPHQPQPRRGVGGQACTPGAVAAVSVDLHALEPGWLRPCVFEGYGSALLVPIAAPVALTDAATALQAAAADGQARAS